MRGTLAAPRGGRGAILRRLLEVVMLAKVWMYREASRHVEKCRIASRLEGTLSAEAPTFQPASVTEYRLGAPPAPAFCGAAFCSRSHALRRPESARGAMKNQSSEERITPWPSPVRVAPNCARARRSTLTWRTSRGRRRRDPAGHRARRGLQGSQRFGQQRSAFKNARVFAIGSYIYVVHVIAIGVSNLQCSTVVHQPRLGRFLHSRSMPGIIPV